MKPIRTLALVTPGAISGTPFARFAGLGKLVTHVVAPTFRQASRVANGMYLAKACRSIDEARDAAVFLICDSRQAGATEQLLSDWTGRTVLLAVLKPENAALRFRQLGAQVALLTVFDEIAPCRFFVEGDAEAASLARKLLEPAGGSVSVVAEGSRAHLEAVRLLAGPILMGLLEGANLNLRHTGAPLEAIRELTGKLAGQTLRAHLRSGARTWHPADEAELACLLSQLGATDPALAAFLSALEPATRELLQPLARTRG